MDLRLTSWRGKDGSEVRIAEIAYEDTWSNLRCALAASTLTPSPALRAPSAGAPRSPKPSATSSRYSPSAPVPDLLAGVCVLTSADTAT
jgi:hypothetical protein